MRNQLPRRRGDYTGDPGANGVPYNSSLGALVLGWYSGKQTSGGNYHGNGVGTYNLKGGLLTGGPNAGDASGGVEIIGQAGTEMFNQTGGTNYCTFDFDVAGTHQTNIWDSLPFSSSYGIYTLSNGLLTGASLRMWVRLARESSRRRPEPTQPPGSPLRVTPNTIRLAVLQRPSGRPGHTTSTAGCSKRAPSVGRRFHGKRWPIGAATFNFNAGTLQAGPGGMTNAITLTLGTAASSVATVDANSQTLSFNSNYTGTLTGPGQLKVIDSAGGGTVILGSTDINILGNNYTGGTTVLSGAGSVVSRRPAQRGRFDRRRASVPGVERQGGDALRQ